MYCSTLPLITSRQRVPGYMYVCMLVYASATAVVYWYIWYLVPGTVQVGTGTSTTGYCGKEVDIHIYVCISISGVRFEVARRNISSAWQRYNYRVISHVPRAARTKLQISSAASMSIVYRHWTTFLMEVAKVNQIFLFWHGRNVKLFSTSTTLAWLVLWRNIHSDLIAFLSRIGGRMRAQINHISYVTVLLAWMNLFEFHPLFQFFLFLPVDLQVLCTTYIHV